MTPDAVAAIVSAIAAVVAVGIAVHTLRKSLWLSALVAPEQRFAQINHAKIMDPDSWESICNGNLETPLSDAAKHLVFETFQFYHQAFHLHRREAIDDEDFAFWKNRLATDLDLFPRYKQWWSSDQPKYHTAWNDAFVRHVNSVIATVEKEANSS